MPVLCLICEKFFSTQYNLNKHCLNVHDIKQEKNCYSGGVQNYKCMEAECNNCSYKQCKDLVEHLRQKHLMNISEEKLEFSNVQDFNLWKYGVEKQEKCNYISPRGKKILMSGDELQYFICNRSGKSRTNIAKENAIGRRCTKIQGCAKINFACISQMVVRKHQDKFVVSRIINHYGHEKDIQHLRISKLDKLDIAAKLITGVSKSRILDDSRNKITSEIKRIDLLSRHDIDNIKRSYNISVQEGVKHKNDAVSVDLWVKECQGSSTNPVLFYKPQGQPCRNFSDTDFCLIVMNDVQASLLKKFGKKTIAVDSTHGLNNYDFEMTTLMVIDEFNEGFPVAFMFSNKKDTDIQKHFFKTIRQKVGIILCNTFMSDITNVFYNAWMEVMGKVKYQLYCAWHVDRAWKTNLSKINNKEKREWVYKTIKFLQKSVQFSTFQEQLQITIENMLQDADTKLFGEYFVNYYSDNFEKWAYCYRKTCGINTNMRLESMHKVIKYFYLDGKRVKRLDKGLHATLKYLRDKIVERLTKLTKGKQNLNNTETIRRHRTAITSSFNLLKQNLDTWEIEHDNRNYTVKYCSKIKCCNLVCNYCNICVHQYTCSCPDNFINSAICKHIHYVANTDRKNEYQNQIAVEEHDKSAIKDCINYLGICNVDCHVMEIKDKITKKISALQTKIDKIDFTQVNNSISTQILSHLNNVEMLLELSTPQCSQNFCDVEKVSTNQKIIPQNRFFSTQKKKKQKAIKMSNPNKNDCSDISRLLKGDFSIITTNSSEDHPYCKSSEL